MLAPAEPCSAAIWDSRVSREGLGGPLLLLVVVCWVRTERSRVDGGDPFPSQGFTKFRWWAGIVSEPNLT